MPSKRRMLLCRLSFILLCVVPTLVVATGIIFPNRRQPWEKRVFQELGLNARIGYVDRPKPQTIVLGQIDISDPDFGAVASLHAVEIQENSEVLRLRLVHPEVRLDRLDLLYRAVEQHIMRKQLLDRRVEITCRQLTLSNPPTGNGNSGPVATFNNVVCRIASSAEGCQLDLSFSPTSTVTTEPCRMRIERAVSARSGVLVKWRADTHGNEVSCDSFSALFPSLARLGGNTSFRGSLDGYSNDHGWNGNVSGSFGNVDMYRLVQEQFPHTFDGLANVQFGLLEIRNNKVVRATGNLRSERGTIGNSLIEAAANQLGCRLENGLAGTATRYRLIDVTFEVSAEGVTIVGNCQARPATMIEGQLGQPLLAHPESRQPLAALARMLVPQSDVQVPLTRETSKLLSLFPIPSLQQHQKPGVPRTTLRLE